MRQPNFRRGRGRGNPRRAGGGGGRNQTFDSSGPNVKVRGTAAQVLEKYLALARDATASGDRIMAENYYQHAEHYHRVINADGAAQAKDGGPKGGNGQMNPESRASESSQPEAQDQAPAEKSEAAPEAETTATSGQDATADKAPATGKAGKGNKSDKADTADKSDKDETKEEEQASA